MSSIDSGTGNGGDGAALAWVDEFYRIGRTIATQGPDQAQHAILRFVVARFDASCGTIALLDDAGSDLTIAAGIGASEKFIGTRIALGQPILGWVARHGSPLLLNGDLSDDPRFRDLKAARAAAAPGSAICWPLKIENRVIGAFSVSRLAGDRPFTENDVERASGIVSIASLAVQNARLYADQQQRIAALSAMNAENQRLIHRLQETQSQLLQSEKMASIGQLAAGVAHEINNPVGYVKSNVATLQRYLEDLFRLLRAYQRVEPAVPADAPAAGPLRAVKRTVDLEFLGKDVFDLITESREGLARVTQIVQDLKDFSHTGESAWQWADLHKGLDSTLNIVHNEIKYKAEVVKDYGALPPVECLASQLNQVFLNLLVNAAQAMERHGVITVRTRRDGGFVQVEIADTGRGIAPGHLTRIFDPFFTTKPVGEGTGLGLSLSYNIVRKHGGRIEIDSAPGRGSRFRIVLPIHQTGRHADGGPGGEEVGQSTSGPGDLATGT